MKTMILAAFAALALSTGVAQMAQAAPSNSAQTSDSNGPSLMGGGG
jgi:hypothetical protein